MSGKKTTEVPEERIKPFRNLTAGLSEAFLEEAERLLFLVREYGVSKAKSLPVKAEDYPQFMADVHEGWKLAQKRIAELLTECLNQRSVAKARGKECRRLRDSAGADLAERDANRAEIEIRVLRRMLDVVLWTILNGDHSTLRRLYVKGGTHSLNPAAIAAAMPAANQLNANPKVMALCTDMVSLVHVGDLMVIDLESKAFKFIELKSGEKNLEITETAAFAVESGCAHFEQAATSAFDATDLKQYNRAKRQLVRNLTILETIRREGGVDPNTGGEVRIHRVDDGPELWCDTITRCYGQLSDEKSWAIETVDGCVHVGVYSNRETGFVGFNVWMDQMGCKSAIYNLTDSFMNSFARPLGATFLSLELQQSILRGRITVIICLDVKRLMEEANKLQPEFLQLASARETAQARAHRLMWLELDGRLVRAKVGDEEVVLGGGFRDRVVFDQQRTSQLLRQYLETMTRDSRAKSESSPDGH